MNEPEATPDHPGGPRRGTIALAVLVVVILWAFNFIAGKIALRNLPSAAVASFRVLLGAVAMVPAYLICSRTAAFANGMTKRSSSLGGDAIMMAGAIGFAVYSVLGKRVAARYDALTMTAFNHFTGAIVALPVVLYQAHLLLMDARWRQVPWQSWTSVLYMAVFSSAVAYVLYFWLLKYLQASQLAAFTYLLPVIATILGIILLGERGSVMEVVGGALALAGVYWIQPRRET